MITECWEFETLGKSRPKGSLKCMGAAGRGRHHMEEDNPESKPWKLKMIRDIRERFRIVPIKKGHLVLGYAPAPHQGPVMVYATFAFLKLEQPSHDTPWPISADFGDVDKLCRNVGDALEQSGLIDNDRQIVRWHAAKVWGSVESVRVTVVAL